MTRLVVIAGPERSGKMPLARHLMEQDPALVLVHRDTIRASLVTLTDESLITAIMDEIARMLLDRGHSVVVCAWNLEPIDRSIWELAARATGAQLEWLDVREPDVALLIPPLEGWTPEALKAA